jgi:hypothetical protein
VKPFSSKDPSWPSFKLQEDRFNLTEAVHGQYYGLNGLDSDSIRAVLEAIALFGLEI